MTLKKRPKPKSMGAFASGFTDTARRIGNTRVYATPDPEAFERMRFFLREIGQGPRAGRDLTREEAAEAMSLILSQQATPAQVGGFLLVQRYKGETPEELAGFAEVVRAGAHTIAPKVEGLLDIGSPYDGRKKSIVVSPASAIVTAAAEVPVVMHGEKGIGPKFGVPIGDVLEALGIDIDPEPEEVERGIEEVGIGFMRSSRFVPQVYALRELRKEIALRTCLSTVEKIYNLAGAQYSLLGLSHLPYMEKMMAAVQGTGFRRVMIIQGIEGNEDAPTSRPCRAFLWDGGATKELRIDASEFGLQAASKEEMAGGDAAFNAGVAERILEGEQGAYRDLVLLNAGIRIFLAERAETIGEGVERAREAIDSGAAKAKLVEWRGKMR